MSKGINAIYNFPFGTFTDRVLEALQDSFAPMYRHVWQQNWNNSIFAYVKRTYYVCDWKGSVYEVNVPIGVDSENIMHYWRIVFKVFEEIDQKTVEREQRWLEWPWMKPPGIIDSESIFYIAQRPSADLKAKLKALFKAGGRKAYMKGLPKGFKHKPQRGYFTFIVVNESAEIALKRVKDLLLNFLKKRIKGLLKSLKVPSWQYEEPLMKRQTKTLLILLERYSLTIRTILKNMVETFFWLIGKYKKLLHEIGVQNGLKSALKLLKPFPREDRERILKLTRVLVVEAG